MLLPAGATAPGKSDTSTRTDPAAGTGDSAGDAQHAGHPAKNQRLVAGRDREVRRGSGIFPEWGTRGRGDMMVSLLQGAEACDASALGTVGNQG